MKRKHKMLDLLAVVVATAMLMTNVSGVSTTDKDDSFEKLVAAQERAVTANEKLMQYFFNNGWVTEYPEFFGGCYIDKNIFHIRLVSPSLQTMDALDSIFSGYEDVVAFEYGQNSRASLQSYADKTATELKEYGCGVTYWYVDSFTEKIVVGVLEKDVGAAERIIQSKAENIRGVEGVKLEIEKGVYIKTDSQIAYGGSELEMPTDYRTAGVCGYYGGGSALVTCGHGNATVGSMVEINDEIIGTVTYVQYTNGGQGDFSIISLSNATLSHQIGNSDDGYVTITNGTLLTPAAGTYINRYGSITGFSTGIVNATNLTVTHGDITIRGLTKATLDGSGSSSGDSGGPYLAAGAFCGVHSGSLPTNTRIVYFTPYSLIYNAGFTAIGSHNCARWTDAGLESHKGFCVICQATVYESHGNYYNHASGRCTRCGRIGDIVV